MKFNGVIKLFFLIAKKSSFLKIGQLEKNYGELKLAVFVITEAKKKFVFTCSNLKRCFSASKNSSAMIFLDTVGHTLLYPKHQIQNFRTVIFDL